MCFAPSQRALFRHLHFQKCSEHEVFWTFWLRHVLRATTACTFSPSQLPKVLRTWCFCAALARQGPWLSWASMSKDIPSHRHDPWCILYGLTSKCASRHNGVQFFISHLARWLRTRRFSEPTFRPSGATNYRKNAVIWTFLPFRPPACSFFRLFLFSDLLFSSLSSLTLPTCFFICPYCRKFDF